MSEDPPSMRPSDRTGRFVIGAVLFALVPACGHDGGSGPDRGPAPAPAQWFPGRLRKLPPWGDDLRRRRDPLADDWPTEAWAEHLERVLPDAVRESLAAEGGGLTALLAQGFEGATDLWPAELTTVHDDGALTVRVRVAPEEEIRPPERLPELLGTWRASLAGLGPPRVDVDIDGLHLLATEQGSPSRFDTSIRVRLSGSAGSGTYQQNVRWNARWEAPPSEEPAAPPRLLRLALERCEAIRARARPFAELTREVLGGIAAFEEEILRGSEDYHLHQDRLSAQPYLGMHGLAVGDVDGDGLEDLFVPQPGGQPNRLLLHQPDGTVRDATAESGLGVLDNCGPALILDLDGDGDQDVAVAVGSNVLVGWNDGRGRFPAFTTLPGPDVPEVTSMSAADPDQDGDLDLYACRYAKGGVSNGAPMPYWNAENGERNLYWRNEGGHRFVEATKEVGLDVHATRFSLALLFEDLDDDGDVDLYLVNDFGKNGVYLNEGGRFTEVTESSGADDPAAGMGVSAADADRDGHLDLFVTNMDSPAGARIASCDRFRPEHPGERPAYMHHARGHTLLLGDGHGGWRDATLEAGVAAGGWAWGGTFFDLQNDGWPDLYVPNGFATNRDPDDLRGFFWRCVIARSPSAPPPPAPQDYLDAWDAIRHFTLFEGCSWNGRERNAAYLNLGGLQFVEVASALGADFLDDARLVAPTDWDEDGRVDLWLRNRTGPRLRFLRNAVEPVGHWIALELAGTTCNGDAIGARAVVLAGDQRIPKTVYAAQGFMAAPSRRLHFGLGSVGRVDGIEVRWPGGETERFPGAPADARYRLVQGSGETVRVESRSRSALASRRHDPVEVVPRGVERLVLYDRLPSTPFPLPSTAEPGRTVGSFQGRPVLVWVGIPGDPASAWLLRGLGDSAKVLAKSRTALVALDAGAVPGGEEAARLFAECGVTELAGRMDERAQRAIDVALVETIGPFERLAYPVSLLFDAKGQLTVVYSGTPRVGAVLSDVGRLDLPGPDERSTEALLDGIWTTHYTRNLKGVAEIYKLLGEAETARYYRGLATRQ